MKRIIIEQPDRMRALVILLLTVSLAFAGGEDPGNVGVGAKMGTVVIPTQTYLPGTGMTATTNNNVVTFASTAAGGSSTNYSLKASGYSAFGSTDTKIMRYTTTLTNTGEGVLWNYVTNAVNGTTITILKPCKITMGIGGMGLSDKLVGFSVNADATMTITNINNIPAANRLGFTYMPAAASTYPQPSFGYTGAFVSNDVIRPHLEGVAPPAATYDWFWLFGE
jgi:hypothetical protein